MKNGKFFALFLCPKLEGERMREKTDLEKVKSIARMLLLTPVHRQLILFSKKIGGNVGIFFKELIKIDCIIKSTIHSNVSDVFIGCFYLC